MSDFSVISKEQLQPILEVFLSIEWPLDPEVFKGIAADLGWTLVHERGNGGMRLIANLMFNIDFVSVLAEEGAVTQVQFRVTETLIDADPLVTEAAFKELREDAAAVLDGTGIYQSDRNRVYWDLASRGRVALTRLEDTVLLTLLSEQYADIERAEQRQGLDPNVPIADHQESQQ